MKFRKVLSLFAAAAMTVSCFTGLATTASAADSTDVESVTYTWDFTNPEYFAASINAGKTIISDQGESTAIMSNPGAKFSANNTSVTDADGNAILVVKTEATVANAMQLDIPDGASATLSIQLSSGSTGKAMNIVDTEGNIVLSASDYTKNVLDKTYTCDLECNATYYLDTTAYKAYIGKVALTVNAGEKKPEEPKESVAYTWDFTNPEYFTASYNAGSSIISDQGERPAIMSNPGAKFSANSTSVTDADGNPILVVKTEATVANAMELKIPDGAGAKLSIQLSSGSTGKAMNIVDAEGNIVLSASNYTKNVLDQTYTCDLDCNATYYLDTTAYKAYIGKVELTVYPVVEEPGETDEPIEPGETDEPIEPGETDEPIVPTGPIDVAAVINNGAGTLLTAEEQVQGTAVSFGVAADGTRVAADSAAVVMVISGNYHSDHGMTNMVATVNVSGPAMISVGSCTYGNDATVKDADGNVVATVKTLKACWKNSTANVASAYYKGEATTLTISGGGYVPYVAVKEVNPSEIPNDVTLTFDISNVGGVNGIVPADIKVEVGSTVTIPRNTSLYMGSGISLVGWDIGNGRVVAAGEEITLEENLTARPVFAFNEVALGDADATVNFTFRRDEGAVTYASQGGSAIIVGQADINGTKIDVKVDVDTTSGKFANANWTDWAQVNGGTKFIVPVVKGSVITMGTIMGSDGVYTIGGESFAVSTGGSYTATEDGTVEIVAGEPSGSYWQGFSVTYPKAVVKTMPTVQVSEFGTFTENAEKPAKAFLGTFTVDEELNNPVNCVKWTVGEATAVSGFGTTISSGTVVTGLIVLADDLAAIPAPTADALFAE